MQSDTLGATKAPRFGWVAILGNLVSGIVLLAASGLKLDLHLINSDLSFLNLVLVVFEGVVGVLLCSYLTSKRLSVLGLSVFSVFCAFHLWELSHVGAQYLSQSCNCFGNAGFSSGLVLLINFICISLLIAGCFYRNSTNTSTVGFEGYLCTRITPIVKSIAVFSTVFMFFMMVVSNHHYRDLVLNWQDPKRIENSNEPVWSRSTVEISNTTSRSMKFCGFSSTCIAKPASLVPMEIPANGKVVIEVNVKSPLSDLSRFPQHTVFIRDGKSTKAFGVSLNRQRVF